MKEKYLAFGRKIYKDVIAVVFLLLATTFLIMHFLDVEHMDLSIPLSYKGVDDMSSYETARLIQDSGWNFKTDRLAATEECFDNRTDIISGLHNADVAITKLLLVITKDAIKSVNLTYLATFYMIAFAAYIVLRALGIKEWISAEGALVYAFLPFIFMRGIEHIVLSAYYFVPLAILMSIWLYEDENFMRPCRNFFKYKKNIAGIIMLFLIASEGIGYWQVFSCLMMFVAAFTGFVRRRGDWKLVKRGLTAIATLVVFVVLNCIPQLAVILANRGNGVESRVRNVGNAEVYCLKIIQLLLPVNGHGIEKLQNLIDKYNYGVPLINENQSSYIGIIGVIGFLILLVWLFAGKKEEGRLRQRLTVLSDLNIATLLMSVIGGFGSVIFVLGVTLIRGYNRICVYIAFMGIVTVCLLCDEFSGRIKNIVKKAVYISFVSLVMIFAIWEQNPGEAIDYESNKANWENDENFIKAVENVMDENDSIFQLPYVEYPENAGSNNMTSLSHFLGYIHSDKLRWSFGVEIGTEGAEWYEKTASLSPSQMIEEVLDKGFDGIYINRDGYETAEWKKLEAQIQAITGVEPIVSEDLRLSFFKLR